VTAARTHAQTAAKIVLQGGAVYIRTSGDPFFFTSGWASPIFIDIKRLISLPAARETLVEAALERIKAVVGTGNVDMIVGCELAGIPFASIIADRLRLPLVVVRKQSKGFGRLAQFEGTFEAGARALLVDDLSTDGTNKLGFRSALERAEAKVVDVFVLLDYAIFPASGRLVSLLTLADVIAAAEEQRYLDPRGLEEVKAFAANAAQWSKRNGGIGELPPPPGSQ
jgi:orotate phosphoribosyltransferase